MPMPFVFSDAHIEDYHSRGATIFRKIVPAALIADLRRSVEAGRELAYAENGPQAQRFQPVSNYQIEQKPFQNFAELTTLRDAVSRVLSPIHDAMSPQSCGVLIEPRSEAWCTQWHRDWRDNTTCDKQLWRDGMHD